MCRNSGIFSNLKILHKYPWISLQSIHSNNEYTVLQFDTVKVKIKCSGDIKSMLPLFKFLQGLYPQKLYDFPDDPISFTIECSECTFNNIFISCLIETKLNVNKKLIRKIRTQHREEKTLEIIQGSYERNVLNCLLKAIENDHSIKTLVFGGNKMVNVYELLTNIFQHNKSIEILVIYRSTNFSGFGNFLTELANSNVRELEFEGITFTEEVEQEMQQRTIPDILKKIRFTSCDISPEFTSYVSKQREHLKSIKKFSILQPKSRLNINVLSNIVFSNCLEKISLIETGMELSTLFKAFAKDNFSYSYLNLSKNLCTINDFDSYKLSPSLEILVLNDIEWTEHSLAGFLQYQPFECPVNLEISNIKCDEERAQKLFGKFEKVASEKMIESLIWNCNPISSSFIDFISTIEMLKDIKLEYCVIPLHDKDTILASISNLIHKVALVKISLNGTLKYFKHSGLEVLRDSIVNSNTLTSLNYCNNHIGDDGLQLLIQILKSNRSISKIGFSGSKPSSYDIYLSVLQEIKSLEHISYVAKPNKDIEFLRCKCTHEQIGKLYEIWDEMKESTAKFIFRNSSIFGQSIASFASKANLYQPKVAKISFVDASWDTNIDVGYVDASYAWSEIEEKFSMKNIIGIDQIFDPQANDPSNLLLFD